MCRFFCSKIRLMFIISDANVAADVIQLEQLLWWRVPRAAEVCGNMQHYGKGAPCVP